MKYKYVIIDDNVMDRYILNFYLKKFDYLESKAFFSNPEEGLVFFENNKVDILFLDIEMPQCNGMEFLGKMRNKPQCIVFITSHAEYALESFEVDAFDYILKPLIKERITLCVKKINEYMNAIHKASLYENSFKKGSFFLKSGTNYVTVTPSDVHYLEGLKDYTKIRLMNDKIITIHGNIGNIIKEEHFQEFIRIHKSYAVHPTNIQVIKSGEVLLATNTTLPLGGRYKKSLLKSMNNILSQDK